MSRINTNVSSLIGQIALQNAQNEMQTALTRLSTGLRINSGADDPAGLIASQALGSDITTVNAAISNTNQANEVIATADGALSQVSTLLNTISGLVTASANTGALSSSQIAANQLQVDSSLEAIDRIAATTSFGGESLLNGNLGFVTSGVNSTDLGAVNIGTATIPSSGALTVNVAVTSPATLASVTGLSTSGTLAAQAVVEVSGSVGTQVLTFGTGTTAAQIASAVNLVSDSTGVTASDSSAGASVVFNSSNYGSANFVAINLVSGGPFTGAGTRASGTDAVGTVNGTAFSAAGNSISLNTSTLNLNAVLTTSLTAGGSTSFNITGGGALFQIGPNIDTDQQARIGIPSVDSAQLDAIVNGQLHGLYELGSGQDASLATDPSTASQIVTSVINQITTLRGTLGAFQSTTLDSNLNSLNSTLTNLTQAQSNIEDADFAVETANLTRAQILVQSGTSVLKIANQTPQDVLSLLPSS